MISIITSSRLRSLSTTHTNKATYAFTQLVRHQRSINNNNNNSIVHGSNRACRKRLVSSSSSTKDTMVSTKQSLSNKNKAILILPTFLISFGYIAIK